MASPLHGCLSLCLSFSLIRHLLILPRYERKEAAATAAFHRLPASWCIQHMDNTLSTCLISNSLPTLALLGPSLPAPFSAGICVGIAGSALQCSEAWHLQPHLHLCCSLLCSPEPPWFKKYQSRLSDSLPRGGGGRVTSNRVLNAEQP